MARLSITTSPLVCIIALLAFVAHIGVYAQVQTGVCVLQGTTGYEGVTGTVILTYDASTQVTTAVISASGLAANSIHGIHIHELGDIRSSSGLATGGHYNPFVTPHGYPTTATSMHHAGDMGNVTADSTGAISATITFPANNNLIQMAGATSVLGRGIILHAGADDGVTQPTGNSGARVAQCVIGMSNTASNAANSPTNSNAVCELKQIASSGVYGRVLIQTVPAGGVRVFGRVCGMAGTNHGFHVHTYGDLRTLTGPSLSPGAHFNPAAVAHGLPSDATHHAGDMGNLMGSTSSDFDFSFNYMDINNADSIVGRAIIVHAGVDQGAAAQPSGNSGVYAASCVIGTTNGTYSANPMSFSDVTCMLNGVNGLHTFNWIGLIATVVLAVIGSFTYLI